MGNGASAQGLGITQDRAFPQSLAQHKQVSNTSPIQSEWEAVATIAAKGLAFCYLFVSADGTRK